jgi:hypothetical protein
MKTSLRHIIPLAAASLLPLAQVSAQSQQPVTDLPAPGHHAKASHPGRAQKLANLTDAEKAQLKAAHAKIKDNPQLVAARQAVASAQGRDAVKAARDALRQTRRNLLLQADPTIQPVLDKMDAAHGAK